MPKTAHTWQRRTSAMSPGWSCGGTPHRAVQNQAFCRTGRPRRTVRYRKRPCGVRGVHLSAGAARGGGSSTGRHVELMTGRKRKPVADNIVVQSELKVLPVPPGRQVKPSSACLSAPCLPPLLSHGGPPCVRSGAWSRVVTWTKVVAWTKSGRRCR